MNQDGTSSVADNLIVQAQATEREKVKTVLPALLADKTISDKDKLAALNSAFDADSSLYHPANILAAESLVQDVSHESEEGVDIRMSLASMIDAKIGRASCRERVCQYV